MKKREMLILMADDDMDDVMLVRDAFRRVKIISDFRSVENGQELLEAIREVLSSPKVSSIPPEDDGQPVGNPRRRVLQKRVYRLLRVIEAPGPLRRPRLEILRLAV